MQEGRAKPWEEPWKGRAANWKMKRMLVFAAQALMLTGALAQVQLGNGQAGTGVAPGYDSGNAVVGSFAPTPTPAPAPDPAEQRRNDLRAALQAQQSMQDKAGVERRLTPEERAELREQLRQYYPRTSGRIDRP